MLVRPMRFFHNTLEDSVKAFKVISAHERQGKPIDAEVQVITPDNDLVWEALPGEIFAENGLAIKKASLYNIIIVTELANGFIGYVPNRKAYAKGNYEPVSSRCAAGSGELMVEAGLCLPNEIKDL